MFHYLVKFLPLLVDPIGLACILLGVALLVRRRRSWQTRLLAVALMLLWLGGNRIVTLALLRSLEWRYLPPVTMPRADVIIVLGGATRIQAFPRPSHEFNEAGDRLFYAAQLYQQGMAPRILLTGGKPIVGTQETSEANAMADALISMGVPGEALLLEHTSRNTYENAIETYRILQQERISRVILVTSARHMPRAFGVFSNLGLTVTPAPTDFLVTQADWDYYTQPRIGVQLLNLLPSVRDLDWISKAMTEYIGILAYRLRGWL